MDTLATLLSKPILCSPSEHFDKENNFNHGHRAINRTDNGNPFSSTSLNSLPFSSFETYNSSNSSIESVLEKINSDPNLIGDASKHYVLPIVSQGKHSDLKEISARTLVGLVKGEFADRVLDFDIIDCRYPYEYDGGHIVQAVNLFTQKQIYDQYLLPNTTSSALFTNKRKILIFHCEYSSERAPSLCRFLREADRNHNSDCYPSLFYPELYVLFGGYKAFFEVFQEFCSPKKYVPMVDNEHSEECRLFRSKTKSEVLSTKRAQGVTPGRRKHKSFFIQKPTFKKLCL